MVSEQTNGFFDGLRKQLPYWLSIKSRKNLCKYMCYFSLTLADTDDRISANEVEMLTQILVDYWPRLPFTSPPAELVEKMIQHYASEKYNWTKSVEHFSQEFGHDKEALSVCFWTLLHVAYADNYYCVVEDDFIDTLASALGFTGSLLETMRRKVLDARRSWGMSRPRVESKTASSKRDKTWHNRKAKSHGQVYSGADKRVISLAVLGVTPEDSFSTVRKRYLKLVKRYHPDTNTDLGGEAREKQLSRFREVQEAYEYIESLQKQ